jgi:hypothetical protein
MSANVPERSTPTENISGLIEWVTFFNEDNGFCVLRLKPHAIGMCAGGCTAVTEEFGFSSAGESVAQFSAIRGWLVAASALA